MDPASPAPGAPRRRLTHLDVGELLETTFRLYRRDALRLILIALVIQLPLSLVTGIAGYALETDLTQVTTTASADALAPVAARGLLLLLVVVALGMAAGALTGAALAVASSRRYLHDRPTGVGEAYGTVARRIGALITALLIQLGTIVALFVGLVFVGVIASAVGGPGFLQGPGGPGALIFLTGVVVLVYLFILIAVRWSFWPQVVVLEGTSGRDALRRSWQLVSGTTWRVLGIGLLFGLIAALLETTVSAFVGLIADPARRPVGPGMALQVGLGAIIAVLVAPMLAVSSTLLYYDLRVRKEGFQPTPAAEDEPSPAVSDRTAG